MKVLFCPLYYNYKCPIVMLIDEGSVLSCPLYYHYKCPIVMLSDEGSVLSVIL